ncbi:adenylate/guanylate cyclase domain-containing protein [Prosthecobacter sp.]|uniref:adenylate/guanylate cyclase domain-containing protein n=1 Tax=Prosthecobacter sp. TaxID=1965333 RepID=UPI002486DB38|nr:adenylate/guanylate cyclase domain-containing protein [Prosthecobacter sp.]MDI1313471.1 adenylate/guanylate cyclase domain-containing protein [Prosthecobacter sp.]
MSTNLLQSWLRLPNGERHELNGTCSIGRAPDNSIPVADSEVSRRHAIIQSQGEREFWLVDLGSANGTYVNGRRISQSVCLHNGDLIRIAGNELEFSSDILSAMHPVGQQAMASTMIHIRQAQCWLMVADIIGSTQLSQTLPGAQFPRMTGSWFKNCRQIIDECGGHMSKYLGDGFFCYWDDTADSAIQVRQAVAKLHAAQLGANPPFRVVLHFGAAMLGTVPTMNELNLHGPEINFVFRVEKVAATQKQNILFTEAAVKHLVAEQEVQLVCECSVDGFSSPYKFYTPSH